MSKKIFDMEQITKKSVITIEKEYFNNEYGIPMVKRVVKEDDIILYEDITEISKIELIDIKLNYFERWIDYLKNPNKPTPKRYSSTDNWDDVPDMDLIELDGYYK